MSGKEVSDPESAERFESIMRVDAAALLRTIKDIEYKLSEHQRQDKMPAWAVSLETRLARIEHVTLPPSPQSKSRPIIEPHDEEEAAPQAEAEGKVPTAWSTPGGVAAGAKIDMRSLQDMVLEDRVVGKVRGEIDSKVHAAELSFDAKLSAFTLEMDRVHKLLQIRPTTSEMQQVVVSVHEIEKEVRNSLGDIKEDVLATVRGRVSEEMVTIMTQLNSTRENSASSMQLINSAVDQHAAEMSDIRQGVQQSVEQMEAQLAAARQETKDLEERLAVVKFQLQQDMSQINGVCTDLKLEQRADAEHLATYKTKNAEMIAQLQTQISENSERHDRDAKRLREQVAAANTVAEAAGEKVRRFEDSYHEDLSKLQATLALQQSTLEGQQYNVTELRAIIEEFMALDFATKLAKHDETFDKVKYDILDLQNMFESSLSADIKTLNVKDRAASGDLQHPTAQRIHGSVSAHGQDEGPRGGQRAGSGAATRQDQRA